VRQQIRLGTPHIVIEEGPLGRTVVARFVVLEPIRHDLVGEHVEKIVVPVVSGTVERLGLGHEPPVVLERLRREVQRARAVGGDVQPHGR